MSAALAVGLLAGCSSPGPGGDGDQDGVLDGWSVVGTDGDWDKAVGFWVDTDELAPLAELDPEVDFTEHEASRTVGQVQSLAVPRYLRAAGSSLGDSDGATTDPLLHEELLADTDWALDLHLMGGRPRTHWHGTSAWERLEPLLVDSGTWVADGDGLRYEGPSEVLGQVRPLVTAPEEETVVWRPTSLGDHDLAADAGNTLDELPAARSLAGCLEGADAVYFHLVPEDSEGVTFLRESGVRSTGFALGASVDEEHRAEAWWCAVVPGGAEELAAAGAPPAAGTVVTPGEAEALDADTVRVPLTPVEDRPARALQALLAAPETMSPGY